MQRKITISPINLTRRLLVGVLFLTVVSVAIQICKYVFNYRAGWMAMFNLDREWNFPTFYSASMLAFCAVLLRAIAVGKKMQSDRYYRHWQILSIIFWILAIDEVLSIHEILIVPDLAKALKLPWFLHSMWVIPGTIVVIIFAKQYWKFTFHLPKQSRYHFILAAIVYIGGALGMEMVGSYIAESQGQQHLTYALIANLEEVMEMLGTIVFIYGLLFYIGRWKPYSQVDLKFFGLAIALILKSQSQVKHN